MNEDELEEQYVLPDEEQFAMENPLDGDDDEPASFVSTLDNDIRELMHLDWITRDDN